MWFSRISLFASPLLGIIRLGYRQIISLSCPPRLMVALLVAFCRSSYRLSLGNEVKSPKCDVEAASKEDYQIYLVVRDYFQDRI